MTSLAWCHPSRGIPTEHHRTMKASYLMYERSRLPSSIILRLDPSYFHRASASSSILNSASRS
jgi:hypothetical protein